MRIFEKDDLLKQLLKRSLEAINSHIDCSKHQLNDAINGYSSICLSSDASKYRYTALEIEVIILNPNGSQKFMTRYICTHNTDHPD